MKREIYTLLLTLALAIVGVSCESADALFDDLDANDLLADDLGGRTSLTPTIVSGKIYITSEEELSAIGLDDSFPLNGSYLLRNTLALDGSWTPIGTSLTNPFTGTFDGADYKISGLTIDTGSDYVGLFGCVNGATILDVVISEPSIRGGDYVGGVIGHAYDSVVDGCSVEGGLVKGVYRVGGVIGTIGSSSAGIAQTIECSNSASVSGEYSVGGIMGYSTDSSVEWCNNSGVVTVIGSHAGGISGWTHSSPLVACYNTGTINGGVMCGGIVGSSRAPYSIIYACYNRGRVSGASYVGGLVGFSGLSMSGCYSVGVVVGGDYTGNISGYASSSNTRCYFIPQIGSTTAAAVGGGSGGNTSVSDIETLNGYVDTINDANYSDSDVQSVFPITYSSIYYIKGTDTSTDLPTVVGR